MFIGNVKIDYKSIYDRSLPIIPTETELRHFLEVYRTKHFTRSAIRLGIAQPSLTQSIFKLEEKIGSPLFHRTKQGCVATRSADALYDKAIALQELWKDLSEKIVDTRDSLAGVFRLGCHQSVGAYTLPAFFKAMEKSAPKVEIRLEHDWSRKIPEKIINYELDFGFVVNPVKHQDLVLTKIGSDRVAFWKAKNTRPSSRIFSDMSESEVRAMLGKKTFTHHQVIATNSLELIRTLTLKGAGIGILPERVARAENAPLEIVDPNLPTFQDEIYFAYRVDTLKSAAGKAVISAAKKCIE